MNQFLSVLVAFWLACSLPLAAQSGTGNPTNASPSGSAIPAPTPAPQAVPSAPAAAPATPSGSASPTATPAMVLDLASAIARALACNAGIRQAELTVQDSKESLDLAWTGFVPGLSASASSSLGVSASTANGGTFGLSGNLPALSLNASASINPATWTAEKTARQDHQTSLLNLALKKQSVEQSVRSGFLNLLLFREQLRLSQQKIDRAQLNLDSTQAKYQSGMASELLVLKSRLALAQLKPDHQALQLRYENILDSFKSLLGLDPAADVTLEGNLDLPVQPEDLLVRLGTLEGLAMNSSSIASLANTLQAARLARDNAALAAVTPTLSASFGLNGGAGYNLEAINASVSSSLSVGLSYNFANLMPWSGPQQALRSQDRKIQSLEIQLDQARADSLLAVRSLIKEIRQILEALEVLRLNEELATKTWTLEQAAWKNGTTSLETLQATEADLEAARGSLAVKRFALATGLLALEYACGIEPGSLGRSQ